jgi:transposase
MSWRSATASSTSAGSAPRKPTFHRITGRKAFAYAQCGDHVYPCADTIFQDSRTSMQLWFYAIFLFVTTRHGVSARELQRSLGVTLKTAWRMGHKIRELTGRADMEVMLDGHVEIDETFVGGKADRANALKNKTIVMSLKKRGGRLHTGRAAKSRNSLSAIGSTPRAS